MNPSTTLLASYSTLALSLAIASGNYLLASIAPLARPELGPRGLQRQRALAERPLFAVFEPSMRWLAALFGQLPLRRLRARLEDVLTRSGDFLGLCPDECLALIAIGGIAGGLFGRGLQVLLGMGTSVQLMTAGLGALLPAAQVRARYKTRQIGISRGLPAAIDLLALCVGAGLDLVGALQLLVRELTEARNPLAPELERVLQELSLGRTRKEALIGLAARVPVPAVSDFTNALIQAELKGTPLAEAVEIKARMLRMQRSVAAEEAAARASVLLVLPMLLLLGAILLVMLGPFIVNGLGF